MNIMKTSRMQSPSFVFNFPNQTEDDGEGEESGRGLSEAQKDRVRPVQIRKPRVDPPRG